MFVVRFAVGSGVNIMLDVSGSRCSRSLGVKGLRWCFASLVSLSRPLFLFPFCPIFNHPHLPSLLSPSPFLFHPNHLLTLLLLRTEISSKAVVYEFTDFQRACIAHVVRKLPSIQNLITAIGSGTLESFCRLGHLTNATMDRIRECNGPEVIYVGSDGEGDGGDGEGDRGLSDFEEKGEGEVDDGGVFMEVDG